jgi:hypothetical protein
MQERNRREVTREGASSQEGPVPGSSGVICRYFSKGNCLFGDRCQNIHAGSVSKSIIDDKESHEKDDEDWGDARGGEGEGGGGGGELERGDYRGEKGRGRGSRRGRGISLRGRGRGGSAGRGRGRDRLGGYKSFPDDNKV